MLLKRLSLMLALLLPAVGMGCLGCTSSEPEPDPGPSFLERYDTLLANSNASGRAIGLAQLAEEQKAAGDTSGADASLTAAIQAAEEEEEALGKAAAFNAIAAAQGAMGRSGEAEDTLKDAKKAADTIESPADKASELCKIATTYGLHVPGKEAASKAYLSNASKLVEEVSSQKEKVQLLMAVAEASFALEMTDQADESIASALELAKALEREQDQADAVKNIGASLIEMGQEEKGVELYSQAADVAATIEEPITRAHLLADIANELILNNYLELAGELLDKADAAVEEIPDVQLQQDAREKVSGLRGYLQ